MTQYRAERLRDKLRVVNDNLPVDDSRALRDAIWTLSDVCAAILNELEEKI